MRSALTDSLKVFTDYATDLLRYIFGHEPRKDVNLSAVMKRETKTFRDPVHVNISFDRGRSAERLFLDLVETKEVQRLRHVRQLGLANLVYHGVEHSRFSHTLGVSHLARRLYESGIAVSGETVNEREFAVVLASAVLHDVGHAPFSHALEKTLGVKHESISVAVVTGDTDVRAVLNTYGGQKFVDDVVGHITDSSDARTVGIISSQLDADRMDYVLRDGYYAGVPNAQFDLERIVQKTILDKNGLLFQQDAQQAIEGYFIARYHLYIQLYYHRTVRSAEAMLRAAIARAKALADARQDLGEIGPTAKLFDPKTALDAASRLTDNELWSAFRYWAYQHSDPILKDLSARLLNRRLFKAFELSADFDFGVRKLPAIRNAAAKAGFDPDYYVLLDTAKDTPYKVSDPVRGIEGSKSTKLRLESGDVTSLEIQSGVIKALQDEAYQKNRLCIPEELRETVSKLI